MANRILWLTPQGGYSERMKPILYRMLKNKKINTAHIFWANLHSKCPDILIQKAKTEKSIYLNREALPAAHQELQNLIKSCHPKLIVVNDRAALCLITNQMYTLNLTRGSVYAYKGIPVLVVDDLKNVPATTDGAWIFGNDLEKIGRWFGDRQRREPKFSYTVCRSVSDVDSAAGWLRKSPAISSDIETRGRLITCIGYTGIVEGVVHTYVIPFYNPLKFAGAHWDSENDEIAVWELVRKIHAHPNIKITQNGSYDSSYFIRYRCPFDGWLADTAHLWHSVYTEAPKKLNFIASIVLDHCRYWKDELKGAKEDKLGSTPDSMEKYWRYNAMDCYATFLAFRILVQYLKIDWVRRNYHVEFRLQVGPLLQAMCRGARVDQNRQRKRRETNFKKYATRLSELTVMFDQEDFTPTPANVAHIIYDVFRATPIKARGKAAALSERTTDEKILKLIAEQHPVLKYIIQKIWDTKKPINNISKYGPVSFNEKGEKKGLELLGGRWLYTLNAAATETGRLGSTNHPFWIGTNFQNVPEVERGMVVADPGKVFFEPDYSQSDARFIAYESESSRYIETMESGKDTHSIHAAHFFKRTYEEVSTGNDNNEEWCIHPTNGVRSNAKRIVHGCNFRMAAYTLYLTMGREAAVGAARAVFPREDCGKWTEKRLVSFCERLIAEFFVLYPEVPKWFESSVKDAVSKGNLATCAFGRTRLFFGNLGSDEKIQRQFSAYFGQGGTAGNINRFLNDLYYTERLERTDGVELISQGHDSCLFQFDKNNIHPPAKKILTLMEKKFTIKGRELMIPTDAKIGLTWGKKNLQKYKPTLSYEDIVKFEIEKVQPNFL